MSVEPAKHNLMIWKGATFRAVVGVTLNGQPWPELTKYTALCQIRKGQEKGVLATLSTENGGVIMEATQITLLMTAAETSTITWEHGVYDLLITAPKGDTTALLWGGIRAKGV